jgi:hypothetical protein
VAQRDSYKIFRAKPDKRRSYKKFTWLGINQQLARRLWHTDWRNAIRMDMSVCNVRMQVFIELTC